MSPASHIWAPRAPPIAPLTEGRDSEEQDKGGEDCTGEAFHVRFLLDPSCNHSMYLGDLSSTKYSPFGPGSPLDSTDQPGRHSRPRIGSREGGPVFPLDSADRLDKVLFVAQREETYGAYQANPRTGSKVGLGQQLCRLREGKLGPRARVRSLRSPDGDPGQRCLAETVGRGYDEHRHHRQIALRLCFDLTRTSPWISTVLWLATAREMTSSEKDWYRTR